MMANGKTQDEAEDKGGDAQPHDANAGPAEGGRVQMLRLPSSPGWSVRNKQLLNIAVKR